MGRNLWLMLLASFTLSCSGGEQFRKPDNELFTEKQTESGRIQLEALGEFHMKFVKADTAFYGVITYDLTTLTYEGRTYQNSNNFMFKFNSAKFLIGNQVFQFAVQNNGKGMFLIHNPEKFFENLRLSLWDHPLDGVTLVFGHTEAIFFTELSTSEIKDIMYFYDFTYKFLWKPTRQKTLF